MSENFGKIISNCPLCEEHALHVIKVDVVDEHTNNLETMQCIHCGYASTSKFKVKEDESKEDNETYKTLTEQMKNWVKFENNRIWIPTLMTLPHGMIYPFNEEIKSTDFKWAFAPMVDILEEEKEQYPDGKGGYYTKKFNTEEPIFFDDFIHVMAYSVEYGNREPKQQKTDVKIPTLKKIKKNG